MKRGGDTPQTPILWAYEFESYQFVAGEILNGILYIYTPVGSGKKWVFDSEGSVLADMDFIQYYLQNTIDAVNERFGTSFIEEDDKDYELTPGETLPNWDAYEKILTSE